MIKVSVFYPNEEGRRFDMNDYCHRHIPLVRAMLGAACKGISVDQGMSGAAPGSRPAFAAMGHLYFDSVETFLAAWGPNLEAIRADVPNYTDIQPSVQISEVKVPAEVG